MRLFLTLTAFLLLVSPAIAGEIMLEPETTALDKPFLSTGTAIQFKNTSRPEDCIAPKGEFDWYTLKLGEKTYLCCILKENNSPVKLYIDRDADNDLAEEKPVESCDEEKSFGMFVLDGIAGEFKVEGGTVKAGMRVAITPECIKMTNAVPVHTVFTGKAGKNAGEVTVTWVPGNKPVFRPPFRTFSRAGVSEVFFGNNRVALEGEIALKEGKPAIKYKVAQDDSLAEVKIPAGLECVVLPTGTSAAIHVTSGSRLYLPKGKHRFSYLGFSKKSEEAIFEMLVIVRDLEIGENPAIAQVEPLSLTAQVHDMGDGSVMVGAKLLDAAGRQASLYRYEENLKNLERIHEIMAARNPDCKILITVSPVNLWATFRQDIDVISASCNSKATLRAAADEFTVRHENVFYFPAFEMATIYQPLSGLTYFSEGRQNFHVNKQTVKFIMEHFFKFFSEQKSSSES